MDQYRQAQRRCEILIPVFNGDAQVRRCIESVLATLPDFCSITVLDDASYDLRLLEWLDTQEEEHRRLLVKRFDQNLGFVGNVNRGLEAARSDLILLNSDTIVTSGWVERLIRCAESAPNVGIVCPLSNNATILSVPQMNGNNRVPAGLDVERFAVLIADCSRRIYPRLPVAVGFCMYIRREVLHRVGRLHDAYERGYGEECDLSLRAWESGFEVVCCDDAFVFHEGERSFRTVAGMDSVRRRNEAVLHARWPFYTRLVQQFCSSNPLLEVQERIRAALCRAQGDRSPSLLQVLHTYETLGGTELHTRSIADGVSEDFRTTIIYPGGIDNPYLDMETLAHNEYVRVLRVRKPESTDDLRILGHLTTLKHAKIEEAFARLVSGGDVRVVHFQHLLGWGSLELPLIAKRLGAAVVLSLHDYYLFCPVFDLLLPDGRNCGKTHADAQDPQCLRCLSTHSRRGTTAKSLQQFLSERFEKLQKVFDECDAILTPSKYVRDKFIAAFGSDVGEKVRVIEHGLPELDRARWVRPQQRFRVGIFANLTRRKGADVLIAAVRNLRSRRQMEIRHYGGVEANYQPALQREGIGLTGVYRHAELKRLVTEVDLAVVPSIYEETFCLTIAELQALEVPVIAFAVGAIPERIKDGETGFLVEHIDARAFAQRIDAIAAHPHSAEQIRRNLQQVQPKSIYDNVAEYKELYRELLDATGSAKTGKTPPLPKPNSLGQVVVRQVPELLASIEPSSENSPIGYGSTDYRQWLAQRSCDRLATTGQQEGSTPRLDVVVFEPRRRGAELQATLSSLAKAGVSSKQTLVISRFRAPVELTAVLVPRAWTNVSPESDFARALNLFIVRYTKDWFVLLRSGDQLNASALHLIRAHITRDPKLRFIYADEDVIAEDGRRYSPLFKPDFNLDLLRCKDYLGHAAAVARDAFAACGGLAFFPTAGLYDLCLKIADSFGDGAIGHIPDVLWHRPDRYFGNPDGANSPDLFEKALASHLERRRIEGRIHRTGFPDIVWVDYPPPRCSTFSLVVATSGDGAQVTEVIESVRAVADRFEVVVVDFRRKGSLGSALRKYDFGVPIKVVRADSGSNVALSLEKAIRMTTSEYVFVTHDGIRVSKPYALTTLLGLLARCDVGLVGPCVLDENGRILQSYQVVGFWPFGATGQLHRGATLAQRGYLDRNLCMQDCVTVSDHFFGVRKAVFESIGGFADKDFPEAWFMLDLGLRLSDNGYKVVWTPHSTVTEIDEGSFYRRRKAAMRDASVAAEVALLYERWLTRLAHDRAYNPNLTLRAFTCEPDIQVARRWDVAMSAPPRVLGIPGNQYGSGYYRVIDPLNALHEERRICTSLMPPHDLARMPSVVELERLEPTLVLMHNALHDQHLHALELYRRFGSAQLVLSLDDLITDLPPWNPFRQTNYSDMDDRLSYVLDRCDRFVVSSEPLAAAYTGRHSDIRVLPNRLAESRWRADCLVETDTRARGEKPRIGWAGAQQHGGDLEWLLPVMEALINEAEWFFLGMCPKILEPYAKSVETIVDFRRYPNKLRCLGLTVAIAPLAFHDFNRCKSNVKILEYGALGIPVVCTDIEPYRSAPVERVPNRPALWIDALRARIHDPEAAQAEGARLRRWVWDNWILERDLKPWEAALR